MPHSCPRCYSPASEAYVAPTEKNKAVELMFDVSGTYDAITPDWEQSVATTPVPRIENEPSGLYEPLRTEELQEVDEEDVDTSIFSKEQVKEAVSIGRERRVTPERFASPVSKFKPPVAEEPRVYSSRGDDGRSRTGPFPLADLSGGDEGVSPRRISRGTVPPTQPADPVSANPKRRQPTRRQRRIPTARNEMVLDAVDIGKKRKFLYLLWGAVFAVVLVAVLRLFFSGEEKTEPKIAKNSVLTERSDIRVAESSDSQIAQDAMVPNQVATELPKHSRENQKTKDRYTSKRKDDKRRAHLKKSREKLAIKVPRKKRDPKDTLKPKSKAAEPAVTPKKNARDPAQAQKEYRQGIKFLLLGQTKGALAAFNKAIKADRGFALAYRGVGLAQEKLGNKRAAKSAFKRYLRMRPNASDASSIKARIENL